MDRQVLWLHCQRLLYIMEVERFFERFPRLALLGIGVYSTWPVTFGLSRKRWKFSYHMSLDCCKLPATLFPFWSLVGRKAQNHARRGCRSISLKDTSVVNHSIFVNDGKRLMKLEWTLELIWSTFLLNIASTKTSLISYHPGFICRPVVKENLLESVRLD